MEPDGGVDNNSPYLIVNSVVSYPILQRERVEWGRSLLLVELICICLLIFKITKRKKGE
jgi:hypothetical protein